MSKRIGNLELVFWPECQYYMTFDGWKDHSVLVDINEKLGIYSSTYLVDSKWLSQIDVSLYGG